MKTEGIQPIDSNIEKLERQISEAEFKDGLDEGMDMSPQSLTILYNQLSALHRQNDTKWAQRARLQWVQNGDNNSSFFFNSVRFRNHFKSITNILDLNGVTHTDHMGITSSFVRYFSDLWTDPIGVSHEELISFLPNEIPQISVNDAANLIKEVSKLEVFEALQSLLKGKSPGPDGFNAEFFRFYWNEIGDSVVSAVRYFFNNNVMPCSWGRTHIALFPKSANPRCPADYRPISFM